MPRCLQSMSVINMLTNLLSGLNFIRAEGFVFSHIADKGPIHSCGAELLRYRRFLEAENILVFTDIKKKHR